ncbi:MAG TPA: orotate phosphoribosyltransferase [Muricauda sp.]|uniref:SRPBCC family protein n=1 Tax=Flagellimonas aurea TaxID=2915619 RepID=A0ABS3G4Q3_9FLAO|nr:SRPBCC family protein [Allomuricauda aurea]MAO15321.1 orotate phosphoribosyltransferase [Allomuricauda sp.]MBO0354389.1 SRPBCC family protein [Allomuricauda aurea]HBU76467.1 orotate phosphoribosyltransferase [Allomuricauda sp.]|tara:strand:+ start:1529 stop:1927 length:399 start_codon:yes stop_codon:yes gene_type:complete
MHIEASKKKVAKSDKEVFEFLTDIKNFETLMPENIDKFEVLDEHTFKFALKGMPEIVLRLKEQNPYDKVVLGAASDKLPFTLTADITSLGDNESEVALSFEGQFNAMMAMMIKAPITNFMGTLSNNMDKIGQ